MLCDVSARTAAARDEAFGERLVVGLQNDRSRDAQMVCEIAGGGQAAITDKVPERMP
jgi:hypothetical protein